MLGTRLIVYALTGRENYLETEIDLPDTAIQLEGRGTTKNWNDLTALLKSKGVA